MRTGNSKKHLMLDLDETLICSSPMHTTLPKINVLIKHDGRTVMTLPNVVMRPNLMQFLKSVEPFFNLNIFTAAEHDYAEAILNRLGIRDMICNLYPRSECQNIHGVYVKDLSDLPFPACDTLLIDDMTHQILNQPDQAILIRPFYGDPYDDELMKLVPFLIELSKCSDIRPVGWKLRQFLDNGFIPTKLKKNSFDRVLIDRRNSMSPKHRQNSSNKKKKADKKKSKNMDVEDNKKSYFRSSSVNPNNRLNGLKAKPAQIPAVKEEIKLKKKTSDYIVTAPIKMKFQLLKQSTGVDQNSNCTSNCNSDTEECNLSSDDELPPSSNPSVICHVGPKTLKLSFLCN
mmetsp:Transcript_8232/g.9309  ORF Transcript_8232/g.9309 Transcript_8232/m.9309 type:complete len:344 (-) Transcript_8232:37-1068(-)